MSTVLRTPAQAPVNLRHADSPERWAAALKRAQDAGVKVYELGRGRYAVTSAHDPSKAYEVTTVPERCTCPAAQAGDPVCLHRAMVREHLRPHPEPPSSLSSDDSEPPTHSAYDATEEALRWAYNDRERAWRDLERYTARIEAGEVLTDREFFCFELAQQREQDASARIAELSAKVRVAA